MIPIDTLRAVRRCIVHANCSDGRASAVIVHQAIPSVEVVEIAYNSPEHLTLAAEPGLLFCDFTPHRSRVQEFVDAGAIVLDHHRGAEDIVRAFGPLGVFADETRDPGVSGAVLALREVLDPIKGPRPPFVGDARWRHAETFARLVGIRDTWQRHDPNWQRACEVSNVIRMLSLDACLQRGPGRILSLADDIGADLWAKHMTSAKDAAKHAVRTTVNGKRVAIVSSVLLTSDAADALGDEADIVAGFDYVQRTEGPRVTLQWSLRGHGVDVAAIAKRYGGGGHTAAAGFQDVVIDDAGNMVMRANPYERAEVLFA